MAKIKRRDMKQLKFYVSPDLFQQFREILQSKGETEQEHLERFVRSFVKRNSKEK